MQLSDIRIVLVETSHPGNIGATARAMKNMGLEQLYLVRPAQFPHADATARASGADELLGRAVVCDSLEQALTGCSTVFGASARSRTIPWPEVTPRQCGEQMASADGQAALVFGRERSGLTNEELERCNYLVHIPTNPEFSSLNVAAAVQVLSYEARVAVLGHQARDAVEKDRPATADEVDGFYQHLEQTLIDTEFLDPGNPRQLMRRLRRLFNRVQLESVEVNILRGILTAAQKKAGTR